MCSLQRSWPSFGCATYPASHSLCLLHSLRQSVHMACQWSAAHSALTGNVRFSAAWLSFGDPCMSIELAGSTLSQQIPLEDWMSALCAGVLYRGCCSG